MSNKQNTVFAPKLRFPEFKEAGDWQPLPLNRLATRTKQKNRDEKIIRVLTNSAEFGVMDQRDFFDKDIATQGNLESYYVVELGSYVYNPRISATAPVGPISKNKIGTGVMSPLYTVFKFNDKNNEFYEHYFKTAGWHGYMRQASSTGARHDRMAISSEDFMAMPLPVATPKEQQKIADCLSSLDELIAAQGRKVDALKTHKKGLMQQLFPREGENQPRLRFPEYQNAEDWEELPLKNVFSIFQGFAFSSGDSVERGCRWLKIADVGIQAMNHEAPSFLPESYKDSFSKFTVRAGDYVVALTRPILSGQLKTAKVDDVFDGALLNQRVGKLITSQHPAFVFLLLQTKKLIGDIERSISGNDPPNLSAQQIESLKTNVPTDEEQRRIASFLGNLDTLITASTQELDALKIHKKGLMQQLFPAVETA